MVGGYIDVDCTGVELTSAEAKIIPGIFNRANAAYKTRKMCRACNCNYNGYRVSPIPVQVVIANNVIIASAEWIQVFITNEDSVTVQNMLNA